MIDYRAGEWGFHVAFGWHGSLAPRALTMAIPNAVITYFVAQWFVETDKFDSATSQSAQLIVGTGSAVMLFILYNRSRTSYNRWWEGGTLLQKARGEWFNAYSSIMAFTSTKPELQNEVDSYVHFIARLMSLLMCCALQQVSPNRDRPFEIIGLEGIEPASMEFLNSAPDKVEIILQWIQRSMVLHQNTGVLPIAPPILSRAFQEVSRGIVNLQNARKIADFPYPYPLAQISMILQILHYIATPVTSAMAFPHPLAATSLSFVSIFVLWCIHFNALDLEFPFGNRVNDLPMHGFQQDWNKSVNTLVQRRAQRPPMFTYDPTVHDELTVQMSDASDLYIPQTSSSKSNRNSMSTIAIKASNKRNLFQSARPPSIKKPGVSPINLDLPVSPSPSNMMSPTDYHIGDGHASLQKDQQRDESGTFSSELALSMQDGNASPSPPVQKKRLTLSHGVDMQGVDLLGVRSAEVASRADRILLNNLVLSQSTEGYRSTLGQESDDPSSTDKIILNDASALKGFSSHNSRHSQGSPRNHNKGALLPPKRLEPLILVAGSNTSSSSSERKKRLEEM